MNMIQVDSYTACGVGHVQTLFMMPNTSIVLIQGYVSLIMV